MIAQLDAETGLDEFIGSHQIGCSGEWGSHWKEEALREHFDVDPSAAGELELARHSSYEIMLLEEERDALRAQLAERDALPQFAQTVIRKLKRFRNCAEDGQGADIGKAWFDVLVQLGLLNRVQRSPAWWEITDEGDALLDGRVALSASAEPSAPVEIDERAEFEQACRDAAAARGRELDPESLRRRTDGSHVNPLTECGWWGWQARATLERKP
ncbi:hypothetical protein IRZ48_05800 [Pseudomonas fulva]|uniref:hypothetical protein n=1 Tax=Pseudomonas fulva TaxID=47880 RepID=UPI0018AAD210|nr:hypothetical protein [Pseudomonas fulva]MBF8636031.1 hypothetical protein [Pseudomonas fulva]MBF8688116.1 hypothetical protein [Pseudomonas fulva]